ncbi:dihydroxyacetone kinase-like predicted kinase [Paenarthrobacter nitroguajacolicus]|uniref:DAK2 domain-containing protein n=1 Tax=Paenarthrobacter TaxID=1742992 RepID=UPI002865652D|nr:DAK2 domain-containing protein [Paenarthrobacter nitroguajacolicus]MDR6988770.1 dihydroxyacetone kinase-like predicted kinase [Paenarthrobacter nitroguajacolicus]
MKRWLGKAEVVLGNHSDRLNAINIFPVADGDTGTNLYLTVRAAVSALDGPAPDSTETGSDVGAVLSRAGQAAMEQARGNSGTLFAVFLCAAAEPLAGKSRLSAPLLATALNRAQIRAWSALSEPVAGTMLSVLEAASDAAQAVDASQNSDDSNHALGLALDAVVEAAFQAVVRTEDELAQLQEAHVVDAGGVGMLLVLDCLRAAVLGEELQDELLDGLHGYKLQDPHIHEHMPADDGVEVMCTINLSPLNAAILRQRLDEMGDSVIMSQVGGARGQDDDDDESTVEASYRWRVHVHVPDPDPAVALIRSLGEPTDIAVSQLALPRGDDQDPASQEPSVTGQSRHDY